MEKKKLPAIWPRTPPAREEKDRFFAGAGKRDDICVGPG